jgi:hypothetical protein
MVAAVMMMDTGIRMIIKNAKPDFKITKKI